MQHEQPTEAVMGTSQATTKKPVTFEDVEARIDSNVTFAGHYRYRITAVSECPGWDPGCSDGLCVAHATLRSIDFPSQTMECSVRKDGQYY
jgi:hypothetical protein